MKDSTKKKISSKLKGRKRGPMGPRGPMSEETKKKMSLAKKGKKHHFYGKKRVFTEEHKKNMSKARIRDWAKGRVWSVNPEKTRKKIKKARRVPQVKLTCLNCSKTFYVNPSSKNRQFCTLKCRQAYNWGEHHPLFGRKRDESALWKGDDAKYCAIHLWIHRNIGKASDFACVDCGKRAQDWSNIDHHYSRDPEDYVPRCKKCHAKYDRDVLGLRYGERTTKITN